MGESRRTKRLGALILGELGELLARRVKDPRLAGLTLTGVDVAPDLSQARVFYSLLDPANRAEAQHGFLAAAGYLRRELAARLDLKSIPRLVPTYDPSLARGAELSALIDRVRAEDRARAAEQEEDS